MKKIAMIGLLMALNGAYVFAEEDGCSNGSEEQVASSTGSDVAKQAQPAGENQDLLNQKPADAKSE